MVQQHSDVLPSRIVMMTMGLVQFLLLLLLSHLLLSLITAVQGHENGDDGCCFARRPDWRHKAATARWMVHAIDYGVLSTISSRFSDDAVPFGNVYSFVDGPCANATGTPYFYGTFLDQSFRDWQANHSTASLTITEASLVAAADGGSRRACRNNSKDDDIITTCRIAHSSGAAAGGDPENPVCARLTLTGTLVQVQPRDDEFAALQAAFFERHPSMRAWPVDHDWIMAKLVLRDAWLIDYYGGATVLDPAEYYGAQLFPRDDDDAESATKAAAVPN